MSETTWEHWGKLADRYREKRPRRMLSLDGGGIRGLLTLQVLAKLEKELAEHYGSPDFRLCQFFDYVGGTSTGAMIAAGIATGMKIEAILEFYEQFGQQAFTKRKWYERWQTLYDNGPLEQQLKSVFNDGYSNQADPNIIDRRLTPDSLETLLLAVTRNATTDSAWPLSSNPSAKYNDMTRADCNLLIPLWKLVRASTAAPAYFPPEVVAWDPEDDSKSFVFVDGGTTAYNNPAFLMTRMATEPAYRLGWERGEDKLLVVSIGTGSAPVKGATVEDPESNLVEAAINTLKSVMGQAQVDQDLNCRTVGRCSYGAKLDGEAGDLIPRDSDGNIISLGNDLGRAFLYARYDVELTTEGLEEIGVTGIDPKPLQKLDSTDSMDELARVGQSLGEKFDLAHLGKFIEVPLSD